jgi:ketosteroid isomerase-like protein
MNDTESLIWRLVERVNAHDVIGLRAMTADDLMFMDAVGATTYGAESMLDMWTTSFERIPDYTFIVNDLMLQDNMAGLFGTARGTCGTASDLRPENRWEIPSAWQVIIRGDKVAQWRIYTDTRIISDILSRLAQK